MEFSILNRMKTHFLALLIFISSGDLLAKNNLCRNTFNTTFELSKTSQILKSYDFPYTADIPKNDKLLRKAIYRAFGEKCFYTGRHLTEDQISVDHILPESQGGPNNIFNYVLSEANINSIKSDKVDEIAAIGVLSIVRIHFAPKVIEEYEKLVKELFINKQPQNKANKLNITNLIHPQNFFRFLESVPNQSIEKAHHQNQNGNQSIEVLTYNSQDSKKVLKTIRRITHTHSFYVYKKTLDNGDVKIEVKAHFFEPIELAEVEKTAKMANQATLDINKVTWSDDVSLFEQTKVGKVQLIKDMKITEGPFGTEIHFIIPKTLVKWSKGLTEDQVNKLIDLGLLPHAFD